MKSFAQGKDRPAGRRTCIEDILVLSKTRSSSRLLKCIQLTRAELTQFDISVQTLGSPFIKPVVHACLRSADVIKAPS